MTSRAPRGAFPVGVAHTSALAVTRVLPPSRYRDGAAVAIAHLARIDEQYGAITLRDFVLASCVLRLTHSSARLLWLALRQGLFTPAAIL